MLLAICAAEAEAEMSGGPRFRLGFIDWMRGLACVLMFQTHCYDSWLGGAARQSAFLGWSQLGGTLPAPLFLFLAGVSFAFVTDKLRDKGKRANEIARTTIRRGAEIYAAGLLFRGQEFLLGQPGAPWTDLLRVDILNTIGLSMMLMGLLCWATRTRAISLWGAIGASAATAMLTPPLWTTWRPRLLPWPLESYVNGVHTFGVPQAWLFPIFPWAGFAFAGLAVGFVLVVARIHEKQTLTIGLLGAVGAVCIWLGLRMDAISYRLYASYDFWHSSPCFFLIRVGVLLLILLASFAWCRYGPGEWGFSPIIQLGTTSLLVYWVHIEFVYGRFSILTKRTQDIPHATMGLLAIFLAMLALSLARTRMTGRGAEILAWVKGLRPAPNTE
jgi:acyltransferase